MELYYDFIAVDFETANKNMNSACSVGLAFVKDLQVVKSEHFLIQPPSNEYDFENIQIHGISPRDTEAADPFWLIWHNNMAPYFRCNAIVAHNAAFDMSALYYGLGYFVENAPNFKYIDTISMAKDYVPGSKGLEHCAECFSLQLSQHHDSKCDAIICAEVAICCIKAAGCTNLGEFCFRHPHVKVKSFHDFKPYAQANFSRRSNTPKTNQIKHREIFPTVQPNRNSRLFDKSVVFTGELSVSRAEAMQMAVNAGAILKTTISSKTDYLVVGVQDVTLVGDSGMSTKEVRAHELNSSGKGHIEFLSEEEFFALITEVAEHG